MSFFKRNTDAIWDVSMFVSTYSGAPPPKKTQKGAQLPQFPYLN